MVTFAPLLYYGYEESQQLEWIDKGVGFVAAVTFLVLCFIQIRGERIRFKLSGAHLDERRRSRSGVDGNSPRYVPLSRCFPSVSNCPFPQCRCRLPCGLHAVSCADFSFLRLDSMLWSIMS